MKTIITAFVKGDGRERLALLSDFFSILGVSGLTILAPILVNRNMDKMYVIGMSIFFGPLCLAAILVLLAFSAWCVRKLSAASQANLVKTPLCVAIWLAFGAGASFLLFIYILFVSGIARDFWH